MAKIKNAPLTLDEENEEKAKFGGMLKEQILAAASAIATQKEKAAQIAGDLSGKLTVFEKAGGNKWAVKTAKRLSNLEPAEFADDWRCLVGYLEAMGAFAQLDMIDQIRERDLNSDTIAVASKPSFAAEPMTH